MATQFKSGDKVWCVTAECESLSNRCSFVACPVEVAFEPGLVWLNKNHTRSLRVSQTHRHYFQVPSEDGIEAVGYPALFSDQEAVRRHAIRWGVKISEWQITRRKCNEEEILRRFSPDSVRMQKYGLAAMARLNMLKATQPAYDIQWVEG